MHCLYVVHASWFVRMRIRWFTSGGTLSTKVEMVDSLAALEAIFPPGQLDLPSFVYMHESEQNGTAGASVATGKGAGSEDDHLQRHLLWAQLVPRSLAVDPTRDASW